MTSIQRNDEIIGLVDEENAAVAGILPYYARENTNTNLRQFLEHRYAGFSRAEAAKLIGLTIQTINKHLKDTEGFREADEICSTGQRAELKKQVISGVFSRNMWLVMLQDHKILKKAHGLLEEDYVAFDDEGRPYKTFGSPPMEESDWDYFHKMRKLYSFDQWQIVEKLLAGDTKSEDFSIQNFVMNIQQNIRSN